MTQHKGNMSIECHRIVHFISRKKKKKRQREKQHRERKNFSLKDVQVVQSERLIVSLSCRSSRRGKRQVCRVSGNSIDVIDSEKGDIERDCRGSSGLVVVVGSELFVPLPVEVVLDFRRARAIELPVEKMAAVESEDVLSLGVVEVEDKGLEVEDEGGGGGARAHLDGASLGLVDELAAGRQVRDEGELVGLEARMERTLFAEADAQHSREQARDVEGEQAPVAGVELGGERVGRDAQRRRDERDVQPKVRRLGIAQTTIATTKAQRVARLKLAAIDAVHNNSTQQGTHTN